METTMASEERLCWVCFGTDRDTVTVEGWVSPCLCVGSTRWCHHACLRRWITEKAGANKRLCPQCKAEYRIVRPARHTLVARLIAAGDCYDILCDNLSVAAGVTLFIGAVWTSLFTYGFITVAHVCGQPGVRFLHNASMIKLAVALPAIPVSLITARAASRMVTLDIHPPRDDDMIEPRSETETLLDDLEEEAVDHMWARDFDPFQEDDSSADDMFESFTTSSSSSEDYFDSDSEEDLDLALPEAHAATSLSRFLVGGLMLPYIASFTGKVLFSRLRLTRFKRTLLGDTLVLWLLWLLLVYGRYHSTCD